MGTSTNIGSEADSTQTIALADVDSDGDLDLVAVNIAHTSKLYLNDGSGSFAPATNIGIETGSTYSIALVDVDGDGDLDLVAGNFGTNQYKLYLNDGSGSFATTGTNIGIETDATHAIALADVDGDGDLDLVAGNYGQTIKLYKHISYNVTANNVYSIKVNDATTAIGAVTLTATATTNTAITRHTSIDYYLTNNGGVKWHRVLSGVPFAFPQAGTDDIRWRAQLNSLSSTRSPALSKITLSYVVTPKISSSSYDTTTGELTVTGSYFYSQTGSMNDIDASAFTLTGEGGASDSYTLTDTADVDITSSTSFTLTLSATDRSAVNELISKGGTTSNDGTVYNLAAAEDWNIAALSSFTIADNTVSITAGNVAPTISGTPITSVVEDQRYTFSPVVTDANAADTQTFVITNKPRWATFSGATGVLTGTPSDDDVGTTHNIVITVTDSGGLSASLAAFSIEVTAVEVAIVIPTNTTTTTVVTVTGSSKAGSMSLMLIALMGLVLYRLRRQYFMG